MTIDRAHPLITPWSVAFFVVGLVAIYAPLVIVAYEDSRKTTVPGSAAWKWLGRHTTQTILVAVACTFAMWRLEHGATLALASQAFLLPAAWLTVTLIRRLAQRPPHP